MVGERRTESGLRRIERGFALLDLIVAVAISSAFVIATAAAFGLRAPRTHPAALALQAALVEARSLALTTADDADASFPTGATVLVEPDPVHPGGSAISVYRSRPIANALSSTSAYNRALPADVGFPRQYVAATFSVDPGTTATGTPFAILLSSSGYASIAIPYRYSPSANVPIVTDPGCADAGVTIGVSDGATTETHPFDCRDGVFEASVPG